MDHLQSMKVFVRVADLGSFARAASAMDISNAVATRHIADLEGRLGTRLLNRTTRSLSLTESGQVYLERARQILDDLEDVEQMVVARNHEPVGSLRIVAPVVFGLHNQPSISWPTIRHWGPTAPFLPIPCACWKNGTPA